MSDQFGVGGDGGPQLAPRGRQRIIKLAPDIARLFGQRRVGAAFLDHFFYAADVAVQRPAVFLQPVDGFLTAQDVQIGQRRPQGEVLARVGDLVPG